MKKNFQFTISAFILICCSISLTQSFKQISLMNYLKNHEHSFGKSSATNASRNNNNAINGNSGSKSSLFSVISSKNDNKREENFNSEESLFLTLREDVKNDQGNIVVSKSNSLKKQKGQSHQNNNSKKSKSIFELVKPNLNKNASLFNQLLGKASEHKQSASLFNQIANHNQNNTVLNQTHINNNTVIEQIHNNSTISPVSNKPETANVTELDKLITKLPKVKESDNDSKSSSDHYQTISRGVVDVSLPHKGLTEEQQLEEIGRRFASHSSEDKSNEFGNDNSVVEFKQQRHEQRHAKIISASDTKSQKKEQKKAKQRNAKPAPRHLRPAKKPRKEEESNDLMKNEFDKLEKSFEPINKSAEKIDRSFEPIDKSFEKIDKSFEPIDQLNKKPEQLEEIPEEQQFEENENEDNLNDLSSEIDNNQFNEAEQNYEEEYPQNINFIEEKARQINDFDNEIDTDYYLSNQMKQYDNYDYQNNNGEYENYNQNDFSDQQLNFIENGSVAYDYPSNDYDYDINYEIPSKNIEYYPKKTLKNKLRHSYKKRRHHQY